MDNFLPNCQAQLWSAGPNFLKPKSDGSGPQPPILCTGFLPTNNAPTFFTTDTGELKVGDLVVINGFWRYSAWSGIPNAATAVRVRAVTPNVSFVAGPCPLDGVSPAASGPCAVQAITAGKTGGIRAADGWNKTPTLTAWADDFLANLCPGAIRATGVRKTVATTEQLYWQCPKVQLQRYTGRQIYFGMQVKGDPSNWSLWTYDNISGYTYATADIVYAGNGCYFRCLPCVPMVGATDFRLGIDVNGIVGDVLYTSLPTAAFARGMEPNDCGQNSSEEIRSLVHWNPPLLSPLAMTFPNVKYDTTTWYGYAGIDIEAISLGICHRSVAAVKTKLEFNGADKPNTIFLTVSEASLPRGTTVFGPETMTNLASDSGWLPLAQDGTFGLFVAQAQTNLNVTFDFDSVKLACAKSVYGGLVICLAVRMDSGIDGLKKRSGRLSDTAITTIVAGVIQLAVIISGVVTLWVKLKWGEQKADKKVEEVKEKIENKAEEVKIKVDQNTEVTKEGAKVAEKNAVVAAENATAAKVAADNLAKKLNGGVDEAIEAAIKPLRDAMEDHALIFADHASKDEQNMREIRSSLIEIHRKIK